MNVCVSAIEFQRRIDAVNNQVALTERKFIDDSLFEHFVDMSAT